MEIREEIMGNTYVNHLSGEMDLYTSAHVRETILDQMNRGARKVVLDCRELSYIDSSGVGVVISLFTSLKKMKGLLYLCALQPSVFSVLSFTKLVGFLLITDTAAQALQELGGAESPGIKQKQGEETYRGILQDDDHELLVTEGMYHKDFNLDLRKVRRLSQLIVQKAPSEIREINLLEQQVSEIIKNAIRHGNKNDSNKKVKIWFSFSVKHAHIVVEDEGEGFKKIDQWNSFYHKKMKAFEEKDFDAMMDYLSFRTEDSNENDGGNAMFAAVEFWNRGVVFSEKGNAVAVKRAYI